MPAFAAAAVVWSLLWLAGFPRPNGDDGFFAGIAYSLAHDGQLANPWVTGWKGYLEGIHPTKFLVQPPLYPLTMAGWIAVFGVSAGSLTGFACVLGFLSSCLAWTILRRLGGDRLAAALGAAAVAAVLLPRGLRPEPLAMLCFLAGQWLLLRWRTPAGWLAGGLVNSAAVLAHPIWMTLAIPSTLLQVLGARRDGIRLRSLVIALAAGIASAVLALVAFLGRDFPALVHDLAAHARLVTGDGGRLASFFEHLVVGYERYVRGIILLLAIGATAVAARTHRRLAWAIVAGLGLMLALGLALYAAQSTVYLVLGLAIGPLLYPRLGANRWLAVAPATLFVAWFTLQTGLQLASERQANDAVHRATVDSYIRRAQPDLVGFDAATLRWQFDLRPPRGAIDLAWAWSPGHPDRFWNPRALGPRDIWVLNPSWAASWLPERLHRGHLALGPHVFRSVRSSRTVIVILGSELPAPPDGPFLRASDL